MHSVTTEYMPSYRKGEGGEGALGFPSPKNVKIMIS